MKHLQVQHKQELDRNFCCRQLHELNKVSQIDLQILNMPFNFDKGGIAYDPTYN